MIDSKLKIGMFGAKEILDILMSFQPNYWSQFNERSTPNENLVSDLAPKLSWHEIIVSVWLHYIYNLWAIHYKTIGEYYVMRNKLFVRYLSSQFIWKRSFYLILIKYFLCFELTKKIHQKTSFFFQINDTLQWISNLFSFIDLKKVFSWNHSDYNKSSNVHVRVSCVRIRSRIW